MKHIAWRWIGVAIFFCPLWGLMCFAEPCVLHDKKGKPVEHPCGHETVNTYTVPAKFGNRAKHEGELTRLLNQHLAETQAGMLNLGTIPKIMKMLVTVQKDLQNE